MSRLWRAATALGTSRAGRKPVKRLPALWLVTDPARTADPVAAARRLPRGAGLIFRGFGAPDALEIARALRRIAWSKGLVFMIGADARLAAAARADGVHLPERLMHRAVGLKRAHPRWHVTAAAHGRPAILRADRLGLDAILVSVVFESRSASAGAPMGAIRFAALIRGARTPVIALGGVNEATAPRLIGTGARGLAAVEALAIEGGVRT
jgi:thiamine-phosphate pyrophosphorylase